MCLDSSICNILYICFVPAQTALDLLTRAAAATPAVDGGEGTASGRDKEVLLVKRRLILFILLPHQNLC